MYSTLGIDAIGGRASLACARAHARFLKTAALRRDDTTCRGKNVVCIHSSRSVNMTRNVLITGGAQGLGEAMCRRLALDGEWHVTVADLNEELGSKVAKEIGGTFLKLDVTDPTQVEAAISQVVQDRGSLDGVIANAGVACELKPLGDCDLDEWKRVIDVNLNGVFYTLEYALAQMVMQETGGSIVSLSSVLGFRGAYGWAPYIASKFAIRCLTELSAVEYAQKNIRVNAIAPTACDTPLVANMIAGAPFELKAGILTDLNALPEGRYITGHTLPVDAGALSRLANASDQFAVK